MHYIFRTYTCCTCDVDLHVLHIFACTPEYCTHISAHQPIYKSLAHLNHTKGLTRFYSIFKWL